MEVESIEYLADAVLASGCHSVVVDDGRSAECGRVVAVHQERG
jgi:hypothetical protein